jgi:hypothetical protein
VFSLGFPLTNVDLQSSMISRRLLASRLTTSTKSGKPKRPSPRQCPSNCCANYLTAVAGSPSASRWSLPSDERRRHRTRPDAPPHESVKLGPASRRNDDRARCQLRRVGTVIALPCKVLALSGCFPNSHVSQL